MANKCYKKLKQTQLNHIVLYGLGRFVLNFYNICHYHTNICMFPRSRFRLSVLNGYGSISIDVLQIN